MSRTLQFSYIKYIKVMLKEWSQTVRSKPPGQQQLSKNVNIPCGSQRTRAEGAEAREEIQGFIFVVRDYRKFRLLLKSNRGERIGFGLEVVYCSPTRNILKYFRKRYGSVYWKAPQV